MSHNFTPPSPLPPLTTFFPSGDNAIIHNSLSPSRQSSPICFPLFRFHTRSEPSLEQVIIRCPSGRCMVPVTQPTLSSIRHSSITDFIQQSPSLTTMFLRRSRRLDTHNGCIGQDCTASLSWYILHVTSSCLLHSLQHMLCSGSAQVSFVITSRIPSFAILKLVFTAWPMYHILNCTLDHTFTGQLLQRARHLQAVNARCTSRAQGVHLTMSHGKLSRTFAITGTNNHDSPPPPPSVAAPDSQIVIHRSVVQHRPLL
ncbi:uncharacterized protein BJ212DRAFT_278429 [Suillus subaureus]|uniref:Uncharacterized protein n=1 Tax=Suillus subaureus TaxID=48587 RepID=A0A9P7EM73_9AGAM|nr:uncharacterized protein BJ212DRAFT_278429 [Suillus subaureus]KAG1825496.1 hypothetical protein BJ212DRAFT_278429 [Suillus subaureus]